MSGEQYTDEFKIEAARQVAERGHSVADVVRRSGITTHRPYAWRAKSDKPDVVRRAELDQSAEVRRPKAERYAFVGRQWSEPNRSARS